MDKSSTILKNLVFSLRLLTTTDCSIILIRQDSKITFQRFGNNLQKSFLEQRLKRIEWSNLAKYTSKISTKEIGGLTVRFKDNMVFFKFIGNSILVVAMPVGDSSEIFKKLESACMELKTFCVEVL